MIRLLLLFTISSITLLLGSFASSDEVEVLLKRDGCIHCLSLSVDGRTLVCGCSDGAVVFHDFDVERNPRSSRELARWIEQLDSNRFEQRHAAFKKLAHAGRYAQPILEAEQEATESPETRYRIRRLLQGLQAVSSEVHQASVRQVAFSPHDHVVASVGRRGAVKLWNAARGRVTFELPSLAHGAWSVAFSHDGRLLAAGGGDGTVRIWDVETIEAVGEFKPLTNVVHTVEFTPDGRFLVAAGGFDDAIQILDLATRHDHRQLSGHQDGVLDVDVHPEGKQLASVGYDGSLRIWSLSTLKEVHAARKGTDKSAALRSVAYDATGDHIVAGSDDGDLIVWIAKDLTLLRSRTLHRGAVRSVAFSSDGRQVYSAGEDGRVLRSAVEGN